MGPWPVGGKGLPARRTCLPLEGLARRLGKGPAGLPLRPFCGQPTAATGGAGNVHARAVRRHAGPRPALLGRGPHHRNRPGQRPASPPPPTWPPTQRRPTLPFPPRPVRLGYGRPPPPARPRDGEHPAHAVPAAQSPTESPTSREATQRQATTPTAPPALRSTRVTGLMNLSCWAVLAAAARIASSVTPATRPAVTAMTQVKQVSVQQFSRSWMVSRIWYMDAPGRADGGRFPRPRGGPSRRQRHGSAVRCTLRSHTAPSSDQRPH